MRATLTNILGRVRQLELRVFVPLLIIALGTWAFIALASEVVAGDTQRFDERAVRAMRRADDASVSIGPPWLVGMAHDLTALGSVAVLLLLLGAGCGYLAIEQKYRAMILVLVASLGGLCLSAGLKLIMHRERPSVVPHLSVVMTPSFPSGHSTLSAVVYLTLGALLAKLAKRRAAKVYLIGVALLLAFLVGLTRVYLGVHYPTDVLAGWTVGLVWAVLCLLVAQYLERRHLVSLGPKKDAPR